MAAVAKVAPEDVVMATKLMQPVEPELPQWVLLDSRATETITAATAMAQSAKKEFHERFPTREAGPKSDEEKQAMVNAIGTFTKAIAMYQQAEMDLMQCHAEVEALVKAMKKALKQAPKADQPGLKKKLKTMEDFATCRLKKIREVRAEIDRYDRVGESLNEIADAAAEAGGSAVLTANADGEERQEHKAPARADGEDNEVPAQADAEEHEATAQADGEEQ